MSEEPALKIWIDADAAPRDVKELVFRSAKRLVIEVVLVANRPLQTPPGNPLVSAVRVEGGAAVGPRLHGAGPALGHGHGGPGTVRRACEAGVRGGPGPRADSPEEDEAMSLAGAVALVAGGTRGAGRGIATELGAAGATVYVTGRSTRTSRSR